MKGVRIPNQTFKPRAFADDIVRNRSLWSGAGVINVLLLA